MGGAVIEWFTRRDALAVGRSDPRTLDARQKELCERARGAFSVADRIAPVSGATVPLEDVGDEVSRTLLALSLLRDSVTWSLAADGKSLPADVASALDARQAELAAASGGADSLARVRRVLFEQTLERATRSSAELNADLAALRTLASALLEGLERRATVIERATAQRVTRIAGAVLAALCVGFGARTYAVARRPDLVPGAHWRSSSGDLGWGTSGIGRSGARGVGANLFFCTHQQSNPWVEFDLGRVAPVSRVVINNRSDCCQDRAAPLVIEVRDDHGNWHEIARRDDTFASWDKTFLFSHRARFVRLRVARDSIFHLASVEIH